MCPCFNGRTHYSTLEKLGAQNITACENQGKQRGIEGSLKIKKALVLIKVTGDDAKKTKRLTEIQVLTKIFTKRVWKKTKVT